MLLYCDVVPSLRFGGLTVAVGREVGGSGVGGSEVGSHDDKS